MANYATALDITKDFFPEVFDRNGILSSLTTDDVKKLYIEKKTMIKLTMFNGNTKSRLNNLSVGYSYLLNELRNPKSCVDIAFIEYDRLVLNISKYGFVKRTSKTTGQNQNLAQEDVMYYVNRFSDLITALKDYFKQHEEFIDDCIYMISNQVNNISDAELLYRKNMLRLIDHDNEARFVGYFRKKWRYEKNRGLQVLLSFINKMVMLYIDVLKEDNKENGITVKDYGSTSINLMYEDRVKRLKKSNVYYSFLSDDEKKKLEINK